MRIRNILTLATLLLGIHWAGAQGTSFTYNGRLNNSTNPANGSYDLTFSLFSVGTGPGQVGSSQSSPATAISSGLFTVVLDFGAGFPGADRWLEIAVRTNGNGAFTTLAPRQKLTPTPYAITAGTLSGTVPDARLSANVALLNANQAFSGANNFLGNVGIGTATPASKLVVVGDFDVDATPLNASFAKMVMHGGGPISFLGNANDNTLYLGRNGNPDVAVQTGTGNVGIGSTTPQAKLEIQAGADQDGANDPHALSLAYRNGGFRHWISSRHNGALVNNGLDFYLNTNTASAGSSAPGVGNVKVMSLDSVSGVKALGGLVIETRTGSDPASPAPGRIWLRTDLP